MAIIVSNVIYILVYLNICHFASGHKSTITFENGYYSGIVVGIDGNKINYSSCRDIIDQLESTFTEFSLKLHAATSRTAAIGRVDILVPRTGSWGEEACERGILNASSPTYSYKISDIQVTTDHPLAQTLPWTKQYKPCGHGADYIILPLEFLHPGSSSANNFTQSVKGQLLLHEWTKLRYGAFEEIGYFGDEYYSSCYTQNSQAELTTCTSSRLPSIAGNESSCSWEVVMGQKDILQQQLLLSRSSIMASPYLENVYEFCNSTTHNPRGRTKHNTFCGRKSVFDVVNSNADFSGVRQDPPPVDWKKPEFRILRHAIPWEPAYAFVIENSRDISDQYKILHVKQALSQFLAILDTDPGFDVLIETFSATEIVSTGVQHVDSVILKKEILDSITNVEETDTGTVRELTTAIESVNKDISAHANFWHIVLITSAPNITDMTLAMRMLENSNHSISVLTFDTTSDWLQWYGIPNTRAVITLPFCQSQQLPGPCTLQTSEFILDHLVGLVNDQQYHPRFVQKVANIQVPTGSSHGFQLNGDATAVKRFYLFVTTSIATPTTSVSVTHPSGGGGCSPKKLFDYGYVITFNNTTCNFQEGNWSIRYSSPISGARAHLQAFLEYNNTAVEEGLIVTPSVGILDLSDGIYPTNTTFAYVAVTSVIGYPVLDADVKLEVYHTSSFTGTQVSKKEIAMYDNGKGADQTGNDGVYSAYLSGYSTMPAHHLTQVQVSTTVNTSIMESIIAPNAVVLNETMAGKCCGKMIAPSETKPSGLFKFQYLLHGFKTLESFPEPRYPPEVIGGIEPTTETVDSITIKFESVKGDISGASILILEIQACCVPTNGESATPGDLDCKSGSVSCGEFLPPGQDQTCSMNKNKLVDLFLAGGQTANKLVCGVRIVNKNFVAGPVSTDVFDVDVTVAAAATGRNELECKSFSDDCLPMYVFWILIGCLALLLLVIIIIGCCWYCRSSKRSKPPQRRDEPRTIAQSEILSVQYEKPRAPPSPMPKEEPKVFQELFVNHAYIQDGNGELKIIAGNGEIMTQSNHNEISNNANRTGNLTPTPNRIPATLPVTTTTYADNMQLFKSKSPPPEFRSPRPPQAHARSHQRQRPVIVHQNPQLRTSSANSRFEVDSSSSPPPTPRLKYPPPPRNEPALVYASVARSRRPRPAINTGSQNQNHMLTFPRNKVAPVYPDPDYATPKNAGPGSRVVKHREPLPYMEPPPIDTFPTSTDSDSSLNAAPVGMRNQTFHDRPKYVNPPPYPIGSQLRNQPINTFERPVATIQRPPVPPPRTQLSQRNTGPTGRSAVQTFGNKPEMGEFDDEENSDEWDDGDFELNANTGVSYA